MELKETRLLYITNGVVEVKVVLWDDVASLKQQKQYEQSGKNREEESRRK
jgi:hypothetical protein